MFCLKSKYLSKTDLFAFIISAHDKLFDLVDSDVKKKIKKMTRKCIYGKCKYFLIGNSNPNTTSTDFHAYFASMFGLQFFKFIIKKNIVTI